MEFSVSAEALSMSTEALSVAAGSTVSVASEALSVATEALSVAGAAAFSVAEASVVTAVELGGLRLSLNEEGHNGEDEESDGGDLERDLVRGLVRS